MHDTGGRFLLPLPGWYQLEPGGVDPGGSDGGPGLLCCLGGRGLI